MMFCGTIELIENKKLRGSTRSRKAIILDTDNHFHHSELEWWRQVPDYEDYWVSQWGRILSLRKSVNKPRILAPVITSYGYQCVTLVRDIDRRQIAIHYLVMALFVGLAGDLVVNHKDGIKTNNHISNLEYVTHHENHLHAARMGLKAVGERNGDSRLLESEVLEIRRLHKGGGYTYKGLARQFGVSAPCIRGIVLGHKWKYLLGKDKS